MDNNTNTATTEGHGQAVAQTDAPETESTAATMQDIEKKHFDVNALERGSAYINEVMAICERSNVEAIFNFDPAGDFPDGYGLAIIPLQKRIPERGNETFGVVIAAIPSVDALAADEAGINFINKLVTDSLIRQVTVSAKPKDEGAQISMPFKIEEFVTTSRSSGLAAFNAVATDYVKALKTKGLKFMSKVLLRQVLASAQFAEQQFPRLSQENWQLVLQSMIVHVKAKGMEAGVLAYWVSTRDEVEVDVSEIDLTDLDSMLDAQ